MNKKGIDNMYMWVLFAILMFGLITIAIGLVHITYLKVKEIGDIQNLNKDGSDFCKENNMEFIKINDFLECREGQTSKLYSYQLMNNKYLFFEVSIQDILNREKPKQTTTIMPIFIPIIN